MNDLVIAGIHIQEFNHFSKYEYEILQQDTKKTEVIVNVNYEYAETSLFLQYKLTFDNSFLKNLNLDGKEFTLANIEVMQLKIKNPSTLAEVLQQ